MTFRSLAVFPALLLAIGCGQPAPPADLAATFTSDSGDKITGQITMAQVDAHIQKAEPETWQALFAARQRALGYLVEEQLLTAAAERGGIDLDSLIVREIVEKTPAVSDTAVQAFYVQNEERMGGQPLESMLERVRDYLVSGERSKVQAEYLTSLRQQAGVKILLEPPRANIEVQADEPARGPADAPIIIVEYSDFECPYCERAQPSVQQVLETYGDKVRLVYRDFPLRIHENAQLAAQATHCAGEQGQYWEYHDVLYANNRALRPADLQRYAEELTLNSEPFAECLESGRYADGIDADLESGQQHGVSGTPAFFVNGRLLSGAQPFAAFRAIIDEELELAGASL